MVVLDGVLRPQRRLQGSAASVDFHCVCFSYGIAIACLKFNSNLVLESNHNRHCYLRTLYSTRPYTQQLINAGTTVCAIIDKGVMIQYML